MILTLFLFPWFPVAGQAGVYWTTVALPSVAIVHDITFDGRKFLLAGWNGGQGYVLASEAGSNFVQLCATTNGALTSVCVKDGRHVAVGKQGLILVSEDGTNWTQQTSGVAYDLWKVVAGDGCFVALALEGNPLVSTNGTDWQQSTAFYARFVPGGGFWRGKFVGFGGESADTRGISLSTNGSTWQRLAFGSTNLWEGFATDSQTAMAVGYGGVIASSQDLDNWTFRASGTTADLFTASRSSSGWVAAGKSGTIVYSPDGTNWESTASPVTFNLLASASGNGKTVLGGIGSKLVVSHDIPSFGALELSGLQFNFGRTPVGSLKQLELMVTNSGTVPFTQLVIMPFGQDSDQFSMGPWVTGPVATGAVVSILLGFTPSHVGTSWSRLTLEGQGDFNVKKVLRLQGEGGFPGSAVPAQAKIRILDLCTGAPINAARLELGQMESGMSDANGFASLQVPQAVPCRVCVSKAGYVTRYAFIEVFNAGGGGRLPITLIDQNQSPFNLGAYKRLLFDAQGIGPYRSRRWMEQPDVYVDTRPDPVTGDSFSAVEIVQLLTNAPPTLFELTDGFVRNPVLLSGTNPPEAGAIIYKLDSGIGFNGGTAGGEDVQGAQRIQVIRLSSRTMAMNRGVVAHETGHAIGFYHASGVATVMTGNSIFWPPQLPIENSPAPTSFDRLMGKILYARPPGVTTTEDITDATELDSVLWPISDTFEFADTGLRLSCQRTSNDMILCLSSRPGDVVQIQSSADLVSWHDMTAVTLESRYVVLHTPSPTQAVFFRAYR